LRPPIGPPFENAWYILITAGPNATT
jgi:hypothetical protein